MMAQAYWIRWSRRVIVAGLVLVGLLVAFPPWVAILHVEERYAVWQLRVRYPVWSTPRAESLPEVVAAVDLERLVLQVVVVVLAAGTSLLVLWWRKGGAGRAAG